MGCKFIVLIQSQNDNERQFETCFEGKPGNKIDSRTETCITNCVERFIDTNIHLVQRFERTVNEKAAKLGYSEGM